MSLQEAIDSTIASLQASLDGYLAEDVYLEQQVMLLTELRNRCLRRMYSGFTNTHETFLKNKKTFEASERAIAKIAVRRREIECHILPINAKIIDFLKLKISF